MVYHDAVVDVYVASVTGCFWGPRIRVGAADRWWMYGAKFGVGGERCSCTIEAPSCFQFFVEDSSWVVWPCGWKLLVGALRVGLDVWSVGGGGGGGRSINGVFY